MAEEKLINSIYVSLKNKLQKNLKYMLFASRQLSVLGKTVPEVLSTFWPRAAQFFPIRADEGGQITGVTGYNA